MRSSRTFVGLVMAALVAWPTAGRAAETKDDVAFPRFRVQEIETKLKVGYSVLLVDLNGDGKKDIVVADTQRVVWYENPTWKRRTIIEGKTKPDNVC
ncbi:MAG TPA: VCBS repeat-containing protein, partial [Gemmataceae bacterium]|nr:VCBS repeat-containing protein [Gemmataceae bacterium]